MVLQNLERLFACPMQTAFYTQFLLTGEGKMVKNFVRQAKFHMFGYQCLIVWAGPVNLLYS